MWWNNPTQIIWNLGVVAFVIWAGITVALEPAGEIWGRWWGKASAIVIAIAISLSFRGYGIPVGAIVVLVMFRSDRNPWLTRNRNRHTGSA